MTFFIDSKGLVRDVLSSVLNFNEHVAFVRKSLISLEAEEKESGPTSEPQLTLDAEQPATTAT